MQELKLSNSPLKEQAYLISKEADQYLIRQGQDQKQEKNIKIKKEFSDKLQLLKQKFNQVSREDLQITKDEYNIDSNIDFDNQVAQINNGMERFKDAYLKYKSNKVQYQLQQREELKYQENIQRKEASQLVKKIQNDKQKRFEVQKVRLQNVLDKQIEVIQQASNRLENIKYNSVDPTGFLDRSERGSYQPRSVKQYKVKGQNLLAKYQAQNLKWKPKRPLYQELENQFKQQLEINEIQSRQKLFEIKSQYRPIERNEIIQHQKAYDEMLRERAKKASENTFGRPSHRRNTSIEQSTTNNEDLDIILNEDGQISSSTKKKKRLLYQQLASLDNKRNQTPYEKDMQDKKQKDFKKNKYAQYVKELNLPLELDKELVRKEARIKRFKEKKKNPIKTYENYSQIQISRANLNASPEFQETFGGRNATSMSKRRDHQNSLPPILNTDNTTSEFISPRKMDSKTPNPYQTPTKTKNPQWADKILQKNNQQSASKKEKVDYIMTNATALEEEADRLDQKISLKSSKIRDTHNFNKKAKELLMQQQAAGDKLVDAIRAKLALLDEI